MNTNHQAGNSGTNSGTINSGTINYGGGQGPGLPTWVTALAILIAFCTLVLTAATVWVAVVR